MRKTNFFITFVLTTLLLGGVCFSLAAAQDEQPMPEHAPPPPDPAQADSIVTSSNSFTQDGNETLYTIQDNNTEPQRDAVPDLPGAEDANLIANNTMSDSSNLPLIIAAIVLSIIVAALGVFVAYIKFVKNKN